jgi:protein-arginine kinase
VYAGFPETYSAFKKLFTPIIEDYHKYDLAKGGHTNDMDHSKLNAPALDAEDAKYIRSTRMRIARNLEDFPLGPGMSNIMRETVEKSIVSELVKFEGDLAGKYYPLADMSEEDRASLEADHFLFSKGDRF